MIKCASFCPKASIILNSETQEVLQVLAFYLFPSIWAILMNLPRSHVKEDTISVFRIHFFLYMRQVPFINYIVKAFIHSFLKLGLSWMKRNELKCSLLMFLPFRLSDPIISASLI